MPLRRTARGRPREGGSFEDQIEAMGATLGWGCLERQVDLLTGKGRESRGLDHVWAIENPLTGRGEGWIGDPKRHDVPKRYTVETIATEVHGVREKVAHANSRRFLQDPKIAPYIRSVVGGILFYRTPRYDPERVASALSRIDLRQKMTGARPYQVLVVGSDALNGLAETFNGFGLPEEFYWPASHTRDGVWARPCPPGQLGRGVVVYRSKEAGTVLWLRGSLVGADVPMLVDLAHLVGDIDVVAVNELTTEERRMIERQWRRAAKETRMRGKGILPKTSEALDLRGSTMRPFDRVWPAAGLVQEERPPEEEPTVRPVPRARVVPTGRRIIESDYPMPGRLADAVRRRARLGSARSALAAEGVVCFADEYVGIASAFEEGLLLPAGCRRIADALDLNVSTAVRGFRVERIPAAQLSLAPTEPALADFLSVAESSRHERLGSKETELVCLENGHGRWPHRLLLAYERVVDIDGGARVLCPSHVELFGRAAGDALELAVLTRRTSDLEAARAWLHGLVARFDDHWIPQPLGLAHEEPERSESLGALLTTLAGHQVIGVGQPAGVRDQLRAIETEDEFAHAMLAAEYRTRAITVETALRRIENDHNAFASLIAYLWGTASSGTGAPVVALELRQTLKDPQLALTWKGGGRSAATDKPELPALRRWETFGSLDWQDKQKQQFVLDAFADVADRLRAAAEAAALRLSA
jgi:hypothetical protein